MAHNARKLALGMAAGILSIYGFSKALSPTTATNRSNTEIVVNYNTKETKYIQILDAVKQASKLQTPTPGQKATLDSLIAAMPEMSGEEMRQFEYKKIQNTANKNGANKDLLFIASLIGLFGSVAYCTTIMRYK